MKPTQVPLHGFSYGRASAALHFQVMNRCRVQVVLGAVTAYASVALIAALLVAVKAQAQYDIASQVTPRIDRLANDVTDLRVSVATLNAQYGSVRDELMSLRTGQQEIGNQLNAALWGLVSLLGAIVFGLLGVMWSIRKGWLSPMVLTPDRAPTQNAS